MSVKSYQQFNKNENRKNFSIFSYLLYMTSLLIVGYSLMKFDRYNENIKIPEDYNALVNNQTYTDLIVGKLQNEFNIVCEKDKIDELLMLNSIFENNNLDENTKNLFYEFYPIIEDCTYMLRNEAYKSLLKVEVIYKGRDEDISSTVMGDYSYKEEIINIYKDNDEDNKVLTHEGIHCMFSNEVTNNLPRYFQEGMTQLIRNEYFSDDPFCEFEFYAYEVAYVKMLCELLGNNLVLKAFCTGDFSVITNYMDKYNDNELSSNEILNIYEDSFYHFEKNTDCQYGYEEQKAASESLYLIYLKMNHFLYGYREFSYFYNLTNGIFSENPVTFYKNYIVYNGILEKAYISKKLQEEFTTIEIKDYDNRSKVLLKKY